MSLSFAPYVPLPLLLAIIVLCALLSGWLFYLRLRGGLLRSLALAALLLALANPVMSFEERAPVKSIVAIVVDRSPSQSLQNREQQTDAALKALTERIARFPDFETRIIEAREDPAANSPSTRLFEALSNGIRDIPVSRLAAAVLITDGQVNDIPEEMAFGLDVPLHGLITGHEDENDRRIEVVRAPRFGIVGEEQKIVYRVEADGPKTPSKTPFNVTISVNGERASAETVQPGVEISYAFRVPRGGTSIIEFTLNESPGELTNINNQAIAQIEGIRENLRVLLVSGEPHAGERAWRNLLKSDASVDLVHFTILRPPEKQDGTPIHQLSLIAFPTRELFVEKIDEFDLIIFDRYQNRGILPVLYYDNIARYVENGGALLIAAGPEFAGIGSVANTPLAPALPAYPTGNVDAAGYYPRLTDSGKRHPVTRDLPGGKSEPPEWGRWFRTVGVTDIEGETVLKGNNESPLLILNRYGEGRVAMLLSDQGWLWARGFEGGGPHVTLYRRIAHWLMKEPSLEEEALRAKTSGKTLTIERQTMADEAPPANLRLPSGQIREVPLQPVDEGLFRAKLTLDEFGLIEVKNGDLTALAHIGAVDAPEFRAAISTTKHLEPLARKTGGIVARLGESGENLPQILPVRNVSQNPDDRMVLRTTSQTVLLGIRSVPLFAGFLGLGLIILALGATWFREGR